VTAPFNTAARCIGIWRALKPDGINQLWVADITCIRLEAAFVYWAAILDAFSQCVIGWALEDKLTGGDRASFNQHGLRGMRRNGRRE
jgi:transposase InsO family protein